MAKQPTLTDVVNISTYATGLNANWDAIQSAFDNTISRDGSSPNQMIADFDMNSNDILNANSVQTVNLIVDGTDYADLVASVETIKVETQQIKDDTQALFDAVPGEIVGTTGTQTLTNKTFQATASGQTAAKFFGVSGDAGRITTNSDLDTGIVAVFGGAGLDDLGGTTGYGSVRIGVIDNTSGAEDGFVELQPTVNGVGTAVLRAQEGLVRPIGTVDLGSSTASWNDVYADEYLTPHWADYHGAVGDGTTDDTAAIDAALALGEPVYLTDGKTYRYVGVPADGSEFRGFGTLRYEEVGYPTQTWGNIVHAGSSETRGGTQRAERSGGFFVGEHATKRGVIINNQGCSSYLFAREQSDEGQSLLVTYLPTPKFEVVSGTSGTNTMTPDSGDFNLDFFQVGRRVMVNGVLCRITAATLSTVTVEEDDGTPISWATNWTDTVLIPQHAWPCVGNVTGTAVEITEGAPESITMSTGEIMLKIGGTYYQVVSASDAFNFVIDTDLGTLTDEDIEVSWQRDYMAQNTWKWIGGNEEQTVKHMLMADYARWDISNSGQSTRGGVLWNRGHAFAVDKQDILRIDSDAVRIDEGLNVSGNTDVQQLGVNGNLLFNFARPVAADTHDIGSGNFPVRRVYANQYRVGTAGATSNGATGSFTAQSGEVVTVEGGIITSIV